MAENKTTELMAEECEQRGSKRKADFDQSIRWMQERFPRFARIYANLDVPFKPYPAAYTIEDLLVVENYLFAAKNSISQTITEEFTIQVAQYKIDSAMDIIKMKKRLFKVISLIWKDMGLEFQTILMQKCLDSMNVTD